MSEDYKEVIKRKIVDSYFKGSNLIELDMDYIFDAIDDAWQAGWDAATEYYAKGGSFK